MVGQNKGKRRGRDLKIKAAAEFTNKLRGFKDFEKNLKEIERQTNALIALEIRNEAVKLLNDNGDGPRQTRYNPKRTVNVSPEGSPPNTDTGRLVQSIKVEREGNGFLVGTNLKYGAWLEFGTLNSNPRPWLSRALANATKKIKDIREAAYKNWLKGFGK